MVEGARLESVYTGNCIKGSNPLLSANKVNGFGRVVEGVPIAIGRKCVYGKLYHSD